MASRRAQTIAVKLNGKKIGAISLTTSADLARLEPEQWDRIEETLSSRAIAMPRVKYLLEKRGLSRTEFDGKTYAIWTESKQHRITRFAGKTYEVWTDKGLENIGVDPERISEVAEDVSLRKRTKPVPKAFQKIVAKHGGWPSFTILQK